MRLPRRDRHHRPPQVIRITYSGTTATFHTAYSPAPFDIYFNRDPWLAWFRACLVDASL